MSNLKKATELAREIKEVMETGQENGAAVLTLITDGESGSFIYSGAEEGIINLLINEDDALKALSSFVARALIHNMFITAKDSKEDNEDE